MGVVPSNMISSTGRKAAQAKIDKAVADAAGDVEPVVMSAGVTSTPTTKASKSTASKAAAKKAAPSKAAAKKVAAKKAAPAKRPASSSRRR